MFNNFTTQKMNHTMKKALFITLFAIGILANFSPLRGQVNYDEGRLEIAGVQLFQNSNNSSQYHYLPQFPSLSTNEQGDYEFLMLKYVGEQSEANGGLFHALIKFELPDTMVSFLEEELTKRRPGAFIAGPVPMNQAFDDKEQGTGSFKVVSAILNDQGEEGFTSTLITSGHAPLMPGSKAVVAAKLNQQGATLLWESLEGATSDVSVTVSGYFEAKVKGYNAVVTADVKTVYEHFSKVRIKQEKYKRREIRDVFDSLMTQKVIKVDVFDRSKGLNLDNGDMTSILEMVTDQLIDLVFDSETGWAKEPPVENPIEQTFVKGRQPKGFFAKVFGGSRNQKYISDNQFVRKDIKKIAQRTFRLNLSKSTTIQAPVYASGNINGLYNLIGEKERKKYFRLVDLNDPGFQKREIHFQIDREYLDAFGDKINFAAVSFRKTYPDRPEIVSEDIIFDHNEVKNGNALKSVIFPRLGVEGSDWINYEYRLSFNLKGSNELVRYPESDMEWIKSSDPIVSLTLPYQKRVLEIEVDRELMKESDILSARIEFATIMNGETQRAQGYTLRASDTENVMTTTLYHDWGEDAVYRISWYTRKGKLTREIEVVDSDYIYLVPPAPEVETSTEIIEK